MNRTVSLFCFVMITAAMPCNAAGVQVLVECRRCFSLPGDVSRAFVPSVSMTNNSWQSVCVRFFFTCCAAAAVVFVIGVFFKTTQKATINSILSIDNFQEVGE